jgi:hypothetical protein
MSLARLSASASAAVVAAAPIASRPDRMTWVVSAVLMGWVPGNRDKAE